MRDESKYPTPDQNELTTASERETLKRAMLHWLDRKLEYAPRSQIRDDGQVKLYQAEMETINSRAKAMCDLLQFRLKNVIAAIEHIAYDETSDDDGNIHYECTLYLYGGDRMHGDSYSSMTDAYENAIAYGISHPDDIQKALEARNKT